MPYLLCMSMYVRTVDTKSAFDDDYSFIRLILPTSIRTVDSFDFHDIQHHPTDLFWDVQCAIKEIMPWNFYYLEALILFLATSFQ